MMTDLDMVKRLEKAFPGVYTRKIAEIKAFGHWKRGRDKRKKRGKVARLPQYRSMFAVLLPGKWKVTDWDEWNEESEFGHCPACGSWGREDLPSCESPNAWFKCTDDDCYTRYKGDPPEDIVDERSRTNWIITNCGTRHTTWSEDKPGWWLKHQEGYQYFSWNWNKFTADYCEEYDLV